MMETAMANLMVTGRMAWVRRVMAMVVVLAVAAAAGPGARGQHQMEGFLGDEEEMWFPGITRDGFAEVLRIVGPADEQKSALADLYDAYRARVQSAMSAWQRYQQALQSEHWLSDKDEWPQAVWQSEEKRFKAHTARLKSEFLADVATMVSPEQAARVDAARLAIERRERRKAIVQGYVGVRPVDLAKEAGRALKPGAVPIEVREVLDRYERDMDVVLSEFVTIMKEYTDEREGRGSAPQDEERRQKFDDRMKEFAERIERVNETAYGPLLAAMPEDRRSALERAYCLAGPECREIASAWDGVDHMLRQVERLTDVTASQRARITEMRSRLDRDLVRVAKSGLVKDDQDGSWRFKDPLNGEVVRGHVLERRLKSRAVIEIRTLLTDSQREALGSPFKVLSTEPPVYGED